MIDCDNLEGERLAEYERDMQESNRRFDQAFRQVLSHTSQLELREFGKLFTMDDEKTQESSDEEQDGGGEKNTNLRQTMTSERGTVPWMAPELFDDGRNVSEYSQSVDVYAFACICWESLCLNQPWGRGRRVSLSTIRSSVVSGQRPELPSHLSSDVPNGFVSLMTKCWSQDPDTRPTFPVVFSTLQQMQIDYHNNNDGKKSVDEKKTKSISNGGTSGGGAIEMISIGLSDDDIVGSP